MLSLPDGAPPPLDKAGGHPLAFAVRLAPELTAVDWARSLDLGELSPDESPQIVAAPDGSAVVYGTVRDGFDDHGSADVFLSAHGPGGEPRWTRRFGNAGAQRALAIDIGPGGDLWIAGESAGAIEFDAPHVGDDAPVLTFLARLDLDEGTPLAHRHLAGAGLVRDAGAQALAVDPSGEVVLAGYAFAELSLGRTTPPAGGNDFFLAKFGLDAAPLWHHRRGDDDDQFGFAVVRGVRDDLIVVGQFQGELELGRTSLTADQPTVLAARFLR